MSESTVSTTPVSAPSSSAGTEPNATPKASGNPASGAASGKESSASDQLVTVKINGQEAKIPLSEAIKGYQSISAATQKFQEAKALREEADNIRNELLKDPIGAARRLGLADDKLMELMENAVVADIEERKLTPEQRELRELKKFKEDMERKEAESRTKKEQDEHQSQVQAHSERISNEIIAEVEAGRLPKSPGAVRRVLEIIAIAGEANHGLSIQDAVGLYNQERQQTYSEQLRGMSVDQILELGGPELVKAIRQKDVQNLANPVKASKNRAETRSKNSGKDQSLSKFLDRLGK